MSTHSAIALNWNGDQLEVTFTMKGKDFDALCKKAHDAFHKDGKYTIRLDLVDGEKVPADLKYM